MVLQDSESEVVVGKLEERVDDSLCSEAEGDLVLELGGEPLVGKVAEAAGQLRMMPAQFWRSRGPRRTPAQRGTGRPDRR